MKSYWKYSKAIICRHIKKNIGDFFFLTAIWLSHERITVKNILISPNFLVRKFCGKAQFPHSFGRFAFGHTY